MFSDRLDSRLSLTLVERARLALEAPMTEDQHERLLVLAVAGEATERVLAQRRLEFGRNLAEHGRIGEDADA